MIKAYLILSTLNSHTVDAGGGSVVPYRSAPVSR